MTWAFAADRLLHPACTAPAPCLHSAAPTLLAHRSFRP